MKSKSESKRNEEENLQRSLIKMGTSGPFCLCLSAFFFMFWENVGHEDSFVDTFCSVCDVFLLVVS